MNYKEYQKSRDLSWQILINENVTELPVRVSTLCENMGITIHYYAPKDGNDGFSTIINGEAHIYVNYHSPHQRQRFTVAHELGHILLGHTGQYELTNREPSPSDNPIEQAANVFASRLLAPACVLWGCGVKTASDIAGLCDISIPAAEFRMNRMEELYQRNKFLLSPLERQVYIQFEEYIKNNKIL